MTKYDALDWRAFALCADADGELWFPVADEGTLAYAEQARPAKAICRACPVVGQCLAFALAHCDDGIFGGLDAGARRALRAGPLRTRHAAVAKARAEAEALADTPAALPAPVLLVPDRGGLAPGGHCRVCTTAAPLRVGGVLAVHYVRGQRCVGSRRVPRRERPTLALQTA